MAKAELKTKENDASVESFLQAVAPAWKQADARTVLHLMERLTGHPPKMWGPSIIGFGKYAYKYASGREGEWMEIGFSPRKTALSLYLMGGVNRHQDVLARLGTYKTGKSCLYIKRLEAIDLEVLEELCTKSIADVRSGDIDYGAC